MSAKAMTFVESLPDMNEYAFEIIPGFVRGIAEQLESIDRNAGLWILRVIYQ